MNNASLQKKETRADVARPEVTRGVTFTPRVDILETEEELTLLADVPGVKPEDVDIRFENGELILHARCQPRPEGVSFLLNEYAVGDFFRVFSVTELVNAERISAELKNGVLVVHLPKSEAAKPRRITVQGD